jgi:hypothetical protein
MALGYEGRIGHRVSIAFSEGKVPQVKECETARCVALQGNEGGVTQPGNEAFASGRGNPVQGGDLKDSKTNASAAQNKVIVVQFHISLPCSTAPKVAYDNCCATGPEAAFL